ncbi:MAG: FKBP-type peptidyl-prolyl cis-trans isomerase [Desulfuromonadaceae bacterium]
MHRLIILIIMCLLATTSFAGELEKETKTTKSGLQYTSLIEGTGVTPGSTDTVSVNYRGTLLNGREFDSSYKSGRPTEFRLNNVIKCWTKGLQIMKFGGKAEFVCPSNLAYGDEGIVGSVPRFATLIFEMELLAVK